jgi:hypothetical protein
MARIRTHAPNGCASGSPAISTPISRGSSSLKPRRTRRVRERRQRDDRASRLPFVVIFGLYLSPHGSFLRASSYNRGVWELR